MAEAPAHAAATPPLLEVCELRRRFESHGRQLWALDGVSLRLDAGERVAVAGPSGCGKTTLFNLVAGLDRPDSGSVRVEGREMSALPEPARSALRRGTIGFVFQHFNLDPTLSALENVMLPLLFAGQGPGAARQAAERWLGRVGLGGRTEHLPSELSGGQQQRVAVARALAPGPRLVLADEPTANLDADSAAELLELLDALHREGGLTLLAASHDPALLERCDRVLAMREGKLEK